MRTPQEAGKTMRDQEELKRYLTEEIESGRGADENEDFVAALKECTDDEFLYQVAESAPRNRLYSYGDIAADAIRSEEYRYAMLSSSIPGRRSLLHNLAISRELDEMLAVRVLLTDSYDENKRESLYVIRSEALLMLALMKSMAYRKTAAERLHEIGSAFPERYYREMDQAGQEAVLKEWYAEACDYAERLIRIDEEMDAKLSESVEIDSAMLTVFLAACHPDQERAGVYALKIRSESLAAYAGAVTENVVVRRILSRKIHREDLLDELPYPDSFRAEPLLIRDTFEKRTEFCLEVLQNTEREETWEYLRERMEKAGMVIPEDLPRRAPAGGADKPEVTVSNEITKIFSEIKKEIPEDTAIKVDEIWAGLLDFVAEVNKASEGRSDRIDLKGKDPAEIVRMAEGIACAKLNRLLKEEEQDDSDT